MSPFRRFLKELLLAIILGSTPVILGLVRGGIEGMDSTIGAMKGSEFLVWYSVGLLVGALLIKVADVFVLFGSPMSERGVGFLREVLIEASSACLNIYRIAAGVLLAFGTVWIIFEGSQRAWIKGGGFVVFSVTCIGLACGLAFVDEWLQKKHWAKTRQPCPYGFGSA